MKNLFAALAVLLLLGAPVAAQEDDPTFEFDVDFAAGVGTALAEEGQSFSSENLFAALHVDLLNVDLFESTSGLGIEFGFSGFWDGGSDKANYSIWSLNRANVPGTATAYAGADVKIAQSDAHGIHGDLDLRIVAGYRFGTLGPGTVRGEAYFIEEGRPISVLLLYDW